jgi:hypothetical protein
MIVKCLQLYNANLMKYVPGPTNGFLTIGNHYNVLEICFYEEIMYRLLSDHGGSYGTPGLARAQDFQIVSNRAPFNWGMCNVCDDVFKIVPKKWGQNELWVDSFWEEYCNESTPRTLHSFKQELITIIKTDKEYIDIMINERPNIGFLQNWHESMLPLFEEVRKED